MIGRTLTSGLPRIVQRSAVPNGHVDPCSNEQQGNCRVPDHARDSAGAALSVGGELAHSGQGGPENFAIDRVEDDGQHDRIPFDRVYLARFWFPASFMACGKWFRLNVAAVEPRWLAVRRVGR